MPNDSSPIYLRRHARVAKVLKYMKSLKQFLNEASARLPLNPIVDRLIRTMFVGLDGTAPTPLTIRYGKLSKGVGGEARAQSMRGPMGKVYVPGSLEIVIADFPFQELRLNQVVAHELIHAYLMVNGDFEDNHGPRFIKLARDLSRKVGFEIPLSHNFSADELDEVKVKPTCAIIFTKGGQKYIGLWDHKLLQTIAPDMESIIKAHTTTISPAWEDGWFGTIESTLHAVLKVQRKSPFDGFSYVPLSPDKERAISNKREVVYKKR